MSHLDRERYDREQEAEEISEMVRKLVTEGATVDISFENVPTKVWEEAPGEIRSDHRKSQLVGPHIVVYWKEGA